MPTTYSPSLRIELIGNGEQVGIWGETTNSNLGTIIETAIVGNTNILVTSVNQVLTVSDGAPDQSRNAVLVLTTSGAVTTAFNIFAPPVNKTYTVVNNSAYVATIYNSTFQGDTTPAGAGIQIGAGKTIQVWSNGTNFYIAGASIDIPLPASQGGTGLVSPTANSVLLGNGASPMNLVAPNTSGNVLRSDGTTWTTTPLARVLASTANSATPTLNTDNYDMLVITAQSVAITSFTTNLTGTPLNGQKLWISITGTTSLNLVWGAKFESSLVGLPVTTISTNRLDVGFVWNVATSKWRCVATA